MEGTVKIHLGGHLGRLFGAEWELFVSSPAEAIRAIDANLKGALKEYLMTKGHNRFYRIALGNRKNGLDEEDIKGPCGQQDIYVLPVVKGRNSGLGKVLAGIVLIGLAFASGGISLASTGFLGGFASTAAILGGSLLLGGITQILAPTPNFNQDSQGESRGSNIFQGNAVAVSQGGAVGLAYGRIAVTPMPISLSITSYDQSAPASFVPGSYDNVTSPGNMNNVVPIDPDPIDNLPQ